MEDAIKRMPLWLTMKNCIAQEDETELNNLIVRRSELINELTQPIQIEQLRLSSLSLTAVHARVEELQRKILSSFGAPLFEVNSVESAELNNLIVRRDKLIDELNQPIQIDELSVEQLRGCSVSLHAVEARIEELQRSILSSSRAPLVEVNNVEGANFARWLRSSCGWTGTACLNGTLGGEALALIVESLVNVPYRIFLVREDATLIFQ